MRIWEDKEEHETEKANSEFHILPILLQPPKKMFAIVAKMPLLAPLISTCCYQCMEQL